MSIRLNCSKINRFLVILSITILISFAEGQTIEPFRPGIDDADWVGVQAGDSFIRVFGTVPTPNPCNKLSAQVERGDSLITILLTTFRIGGGCTQSPEPQRFSQTISGLSPGVYSVKVIYFGRTIKEQSVAILPTK
ncbi:MAG: hypothetical protein HZA13_02100 [Nitrospirae bacterium]|nr:hypothetical protein [Nitrospirota bacterium]